MTNINGFVLLHIDKNHSLDILNYINDIISQQKNIVVFNSYNNSYNPKIPIMHINQIKFFEGSLFVFDILSLMIAVSCHKYQDIYYYATDCAWLSDPSSKFSFWSEMIDNPKVNIIAKTQEIYDVYSNIWKTPLCVAGDMKSNEFIQYIR